MSHRYPVLSIVCLAALVACTAPTGGAGDLGGGDGDGDTGLGDGDGDISVGSNSGDGDISVGDGDGDGDHTGMCKPKVIGLLRDFQAGGDVGACPMNGDFQNSWTNPVPDIGWLEPGIAAPVLGDDKKPVFSSGSFTTVTSGATFDTWYRDSPTCNRTFEHEIQMTEDPVTGNLVYSSEAFFPLDGLGFGNSGMDDFGVSHNFHFTFELHMTFVYEGGEVFNFSGDDDLFVFIDNKLALDLGGVHAPQEGSIALNTLGLEVGKEYPIDFFHAERSTSQSNFHIETSLQFTNCEPIFVVK